VLTSLLCNIVRLISVQMTTGKLVNLMQHLKIKEHITQGNWFETNVVCGDVRIHKR